MTATTNDAMPEWSNIEDILKPDGVIESLAVWDDQLLDDAFLLKLTGLEIIPDVAEVSILVKNAAGVELILDETEIGYDLDLGTQVSSYRVPVLVNTALKSCQEVR